MPRLLLAIALFSSTLSAQEFAPIVDSEVTPAAYAAPTNCASPGNCTATVDCSTACTPQYTWIKTDFLYWQPHIRSLDYAATEDGTSLAIGAGETQRVSLNRDAGFRIELGHMTKAGWSLSAAYTHLQSDGSANVERPAGIGQLFSTLGHPGGPEEADVASATTSLDFNVFDLAARTRIVDQRFRRVEILGGLRWANIDHELNATFDGRDYVNGLIADRMEVNAFGLFVGGLAEWRMAGTWSIFGQASGGVLYGQMSNTRVETNLNGLEQLVDIKDEYGQPIFNFDTRVGIAKRCGQLDIRVGYDVNVWTGIGDRIRFTDDIEEASYNASSGDLLLQGMFVQAQLTF